MAQNQHYYHDLAEKEFKDVFFLSIYYGKIPDFSSTLTSESIKNTLISEHLQVHMI
jgi:hypothetical protein